MATAKKPSAPADRVALYDALVASIPEIERKGAANPYTSVNGHMFSYLHPSGAMALRLPPEAREEFLARYQTTLFEAYDIVQKEYVTVPDDLLGRTAELATYLQMGHEYVKTLKPKPTSQKS